MDKFVPNKDATYKVGPLTMEQVREIEVLLREGALVVADE